jgi:hypothetical protein
MKPYTLGNGLIIRRENSNVETKMSCFTLIRPAATFSLREKGSRLTTLGQAARTCRECCDSLSQRERVGEREEARNDVL